MTRRAAVAAVVTAMAVVALGGVARAGSYVVVQDDESAFLALLAQRGESTVVDSGGAFAPDPAPASGVASVPRAGVVAGRDFAFTVRDVNFANAPDGVLAAGHDVASPSTLAVESPAANGGAVGAGTFGYDSLGATDGTTTRNALLVEFTTTPDGLGIGHFALDLVDFEAGGTPGELRLYDGGLLVFARTFTFPGPGLGNGETHFLGVVAADPSSFFDQVVLVVGDETTAAGTENWAADRFRFGVAHNPEPGAWALFAAGAAAFAAAVRRLRTRRAAAPPRIDP